MTDQTFSCLGFSLPVPSQTQQQIAHMTINRL